MMARYHQHSGYLADDEAGHSRYIARVQPPKKPLLPESGPAFKLGRVPQPPSRKLPQSYQQSPKHSQTFGSFLDFLTEGQILDSLQTVVEKATEHMATMKTEAGLPLVEAQDPMEEPNSKRRGRSLRTLSTVHRHRAWPTLCAGYPNNYPSRSSSVSDAHSILAGRLGPHTQDSQPGARGSLPPMKDRLLLEKNLKRLLRLENKGKGRNQSYSQRDSLQWDSLGSQTSRPPWSEEQPLSWFPGLLGSWSATPETSKLGLGEQELIFLRQELNKEIKSLLNQLEALNLSGYCTLREPYRTLDFLADHRLFPALQNVVTQAVEKLRTACCHNGFPLFPVASEPTRVLSVNSDLQPDSKTAMPIFEENKEELGDSPPTTSKPVTFRKRSKVKQGSPATSNTQMTSRFMIKSPTRLTKKKPLPSISSSMSYISNPWHEELNFLVQQAVSLLVCKYKFEDSLGKQLGFISFPITEALMDIFLGFKKVKGTHICLSSDINWSCLIWKMEEAKLARQASKVRASQTSTSHEASQHSRETPSVKSKPVDTSQDRATESSPSFHSEMPIHQVLSPWDPDRAQEQTPMDLSEPRLSIFPDINIDQSKELVNIEDGEQGGEEDEEDNGSEEGEADEIASPEEEYISSTFPECDLEDLINQPMGHKDPPPRDPCKT